MRILFLSILLGLSTSTFASDHPGNVFLAGDDVRVPLPPAWTTWTAIDIDHKEVAHGTPAAGVADLGKLPVGYFELREKPNTPKITAAVLPKITASPDTPIALDTGITWFYTDQQQIRDACTLCRIAGVTWIRERGSWPELETARGVWAPDGKYERAMRLEHQAGLKILQVNHISPPWANPKTTHFPDDLRDVFNFYKGLVVRWKGLADAIEPWNEPDIDMFGGHTGCEIASFQKAAYLGFKAGDPTFRVNQAVFAIDREETLLEYAANEVYPYFDLYNLHHYIGLNNYPRAYGRHRVASAGRPLWTTEFNLTVKFTDPSHEPADDELRVQCFRVAKTFATALNEGTEKAFFFILGDYVERDSQFGLLHGDLTPRPGYVAFAAVGRLLADAHPLGRVDLGNDKLRAFLFATNVDGTPRETLIAWSETAQTPLILPLTADDAFDYLGRPTPPKGITLTRAPVYLLLPPGSSKSLKLIPPPAKPAFKPAGTPSPVVLQLLGPTDFNQSAYKLDDKRTLRLVAYNFGDQPAKGPLTLEGATTPNASLDLPPGGRVELPITVDPTADILTIRADLGGSGKPLVSARVVK